MLIKKPDTIRSSEITDERTYLNRRNFMRAGALAASAIGTGALYRTLLAPALETKDAAGDAIAREAIAQNAKANGEELTPYADVTSYNNFYEFGTDKYSPGRRARQFPQAPQPWTVSVEGLVGRPQTFDVDSLVHLAGGAEERIYRLRCVEGWSMVIPWMGFPLAKVLSAVEPLGDAAYVAFESLADPKQMPNLYGAGLDFPYTEGLRLDEAMHPLTILATGLYGKRLPGQNGAPLRLVVPWKYGFKSIKSIVRITLTKDVPPTTWNLSAPREYGFYSNVNPEVDHPRWSQRKERRIGEFLRRPTLPFNGYADQVAGLYQGMNLRKFY
jgi:sulfoxide reductase catalytic subunit YedY